MENVDPCRASANCFTVAFANQVGIVGLLTIHHGFVVFELSRDIINVFTNRGFDYESCCDIDPANWLSILAPSP